MKSEIQLAYDAGRFERSSTSKEWNNLKLAVDTAERIHVTDTSGLKPYLSTFIENPKPLMRTLIFKSNKVSISQGLIDFSPKTLDKNYKIEVHVSETKTRILFTDVSTNKSSLIENLANSSVGAGGMILNNEKYMITLEWNTANTANVKRIVVNLKQKEAKMVYYNE